MSFVTQRRQMVDSQIAYRGVSNPRILEAFRAVPREQFVPRGLAELAYQDRPLPIGHGQTISQPYVVALTIDALGLSPEDRVLEVGTGSGYSAAVLSHLVDEVFTVERLPSLAAEAQTRLMQLGYHNVHVRCGDGTLGWPENAPYDAIAVAASAPTVPTRLRSQLALGGRLVIPVGLEQSSQVLTRIVRKDKRRFHKEEISPVCFVPLVGAQGWPKEKWFRRGLGR